MSLLAVLPLVEKAIDRLFPDPEKAKEARLRLIELEQAGDFKRLDAEVQLLLSQLDVNKEEAGSSHWFVASWRPFIGWVGGVGLAWQFIMYPTVTWFGVTAPPLDSGQLFILLSSMLGIGGMRSLDKFNKVDTKNIK